LWLLALLVVVLAGCGESDSGGMGGGGPGFQPTDPERPGPFVVASYQASYEVSGFGTFSALVHYPARISETTPAQGLPDEPYPSLVLSNGYAASAVMLTWLSEHLASHGYVVLGFTPQNPFALDVTNWADGFRQGLAFLYVENSRIDSPVFGLVSTERTGLIGLSMGGAGALEAAGNGVEADAVVALAPGINDLGRFIFMETIEAAERIQVPTQIQVGNRDCFINPKEGSMLRFTNLTDQGAATYYDIVTARKLYVEIEGANHVAYINEDIADVGNDIVVDLIPIDCAATISTAEQHRIAAKYATMWFDTYLYGITLWDQALFGKGIREDLGSGVLSAFRID
jgi:hypothetical protein